MRILVAGILGLALIAGAVIPASADIFESVRPADTALREALGDDRRAYYFQTPGLDHQPKEEAVSSVTKLESGQRLRPAGLYDMDKAFEMYLTQQLKSDRDYKNSISATHPLVLLEYSSPVLADVLKHYRMTSYERLSIEQGRLQAISRSTESDADILVRQSERGCLERNESRGLIAAMRLCQANVKPFSGLTGVDGSGSLEDGRRRIHVVAGALGRLGLEQARIEDVVALTGEVVISNDSVEEHLADVTFEKKAASLRQGSVRKWRETYDKFRSSGRAGVAKLEELSLPGVPVTSRVLAELGLLDEHERALMIYKAASLQAFLQTGQIFRQAMSYLDLCGRDPLLVAAYRRIILEKKDLLAQAVTRADKLRGGVVEYKELFDSLAVAADKARRRMREQEKSMMPSVVRDEFFPGL